MLDFYSPDIFSKSILALDIETTSKGNFPDPYQDEVLLISLYNGDFSLVLSPGEWCKDLWNWLDDKNNLCIMHNVTFDLRFLWALGYTGTPKVWDTLLAERVLTNGTFAPCGLDSVVLRRLGKKLDKAIRESFLKHLGNFTKEQIEYSREDVLYLIKLYDLQKKEAISANMLVTVKLENALAPAVASMEYIGVGFDLAQWERLKAQVTKEINQLYRKVVIELDFPYTEDIFSEGVVYSDLNLNSPVTMRNHLADHGIYLENLQEKTLTQYLRKNPKATILDSIIRYKKGTKKLGYNYPQYINPVTGRLHTEYNQLGARSGRFTSSNPNLQNVVATQEWRDMFRAEDGYLYVTADYSQQEMRVLAEMSGDANLQDVCRSSDIHLENARRIYNDPTIEKGDKRRTIAKALGFAIAYGASPKTIASGANIPLFEAERVVNYVRTQFAVAEQWANKQIRHAEKWGWVATMDGRRRYFDIKEGEFGWENAARNSPIQGTGADMVKLGMLYIHQRILKEGLDAALILTVHDEVVVRGREEEIEYIQEVVIDELEKAGRHYVKSVPTPAGAVIGKTWRKG